MGEPDVSLIIPTYRREGPLREMLRAILAQLSPLFEVIVVDQTPSHEPDTERFLSDVARDIRYVRLERPSLPAARNVGIREAQGKIVLFLDDDVYPGPEIASKHLRNYADPKVGGVAGRVHISPFPDPDGYPWPDGPDIFDRNERGERPFVRGCNMSFRRDLALKAGLFDERFVGDVSGEEEDFAFAIRRLGYRIIFDPEAWVIHLIEPKGGRRVEWMDMGESPTFYRNKFYFALKNLSMPDFWRVLGDTYRSGAWRKRNFLRRQKAFLTGLWRGWKAYQEAGWRLERLPYRYLEPK
jgi:GT2 family glycosyltransferase